MAKSGGLNKTKARKLVQEINSQLTKFETHYKNLEKAILTIETGKNSDGETGLWSGKKAKTWVINAKTHCARDAKLYQNLQDCCQTMQVMIDMTKHE